jgi:chorismate--pyruvate lyase
VRPASLRRARWLAHADGVRADAAMRDWLSTPGSLTARLIAHSRQFRVQKLRQAPNRCLADEAAAIGLARQQRVWEREVLLRCDGRPVVYGHTVVPMSATARCSRRWASARSARPCSTIRWSSVASLNLRGSARATLY